MVKLETLMVAFEGSVEDLKVQLFVAIQSNGVVEKVSFQDGSLIIRSPFDAVN